MKIKVSETSGVALDWLVAKCEGYSLTSDGINHLLEKGKELLILGPNSSALHYSPSTDLHAGGKLIERELCSLHYDIGLGRWRAFHHSAIDVICEGPTMLIAAMRWYVTSKLGSEVEIPDLLNTPL